MKNAIIFPGTACKPEDYWYQWLQKKLESRGYKATIAYYEDMNRTPIAEFLPKVLKDYPLDQETVLIGHSAGGPLILGMLEANNVKIKQAVIVAGFCEKLPPAAGEDVILQPSYDWDKIKAHATDFVFINSDNDPWGCDDKQGRKMFDKLGGTQIVRHEGHFGSASFNQPYKEFPFLERLIGVEA